MNPVKISQLDINVLLNSTDSLVIDDGIDTTRTSLATLSDYLSGAITENFDALGDQFDTLSDFVDEKFNQTTLGSVTEDTILDLESSGKLITFTDTSNITAYVTDVINSPGYTVSLAQMDTGTITIALSDDYVLGSLVSYGDLLETAGPGSTANIICTSNNTFLVTGLLQ